jgi:3-hydroxyisobutyrate dehydrogenase-like beta-hydroxyacid dehydrogenase
MDVGFVGLGHMGRAIAANLIRAGHHLRVWNRSPGRAQELVALGAESVARPAEAARAAVLMSMLADDGALRALIAQGLIDEASPGLIHVNLATISVQFAQELSELHRARGLTYVAAPVFGRPDVAAAGKLNVVAAGPSEALARVEPLLGAISARVWPVGSDPVRANVIKLAGNFMLASAIETMGEAVALAQGYGVGAAEVLGILTSTLFAAPAYQVYGRLIAEQRYEPASFTLKLGLKDVRLALQAAEAVHVALPIGSILRDHFLEGIATGEAERDWAVLARLSLRRAGLTSER